MNGSFEHRLTFGDEKPTGCSQPEAVIRGVLSESP